MTNLNKILIGVFLVQIGLFFAVRAQGDDTTIAQSKPLLPALKGDTVTKVQIFDSTSDGKDAKPSVVLEKQGDKWVATSHGGYPADGASIGTFVGKFSAMQSRGPLATAQARQAQLRVAATDYERKVVLNHGGGTSTIYLGVAPKFRQTAVRVDNATETHGVSQPSSSDAAASITEWVDPVYMTLDKAAVVSLSIENKAGTVALERGDDKQWKTAGAASPAGPTLPAIDQGAVDKLLDSLAKITMTDIVAKTADTSHGFESAAARITVGLTAAADKAGAAPQREVFIVELGAKQDGSYLLRSLDKGFVVKVAATSFDAFVDTDAKKLEAKPGAAAKDKAPAMPPGGMRLPPGTKLPPGFKLPPGMQRPPPPQ